MKESQSFVVGTTVFRVYPEDYTVSVQAYEGISKEHPDEVIVGGAVIGKGVIHRRYYHKIVMAKNGQVLDYRDKVALSRYDEEHGFVAGEDFYFFKVDGLNILPVICQELTKPRIWKQLRGKVDLVTVHIGTPMWNEAQAKRWKSLINFISSWFNTTVVVSVGGGKGIDISGVYKYDKR